MPAIAVIPPGRAGLRCSPTAHYPPAGDGGPLGDVRCGRRRGRARGGDGRRVLRWRRRGAGRAAPPTQHRGDHHHDGPDHHGATAAAVHGTAAAPSPAGRQPRRHRAGATRGAGGRHVAARPGRRRWHRGQLHVRRGGRRRGPGRGHHVLVRSCARDDHARRDGQGPQRHRARDRARRRRSRDPQRRRAAADPLHEHLRRGSGLDDLALPGPGPPPPDAAEPDLRRRQLDRRRHRGRRRWRRLRPRRSGQGGQQPLRPQPLRRVGARPRRRRPTGAEPVAGPARLRRAVDVRRCARRGRRVLERRRPQQHRGVVGGAQQRDQPQHGGRLGRQPRPGGTPGGGSGAAIYADGNDFTVESPARSSRTTTPTRAGAPSSSSATTAPAR